MLSGWPGWSSSSWSKNIRPERVYATALVVDSGRAASLQESGGRRHLIVACCISLRKTRMHPSLHHRRPDVSHPISLLPLTTALPISSFAGGCQSHGRGMQAAAASIPDNITLPALSPPRHPGTPRRAAPRRILAHPYLVLVLKAASVQSQMCASTPCLPCLALPCLDSTPAAGLHVACWSPPAAAQHKQQLIIAPAPRKRGALIAVLADGASVCSGSSGSPIPHFRTHPAGPDFQSETSSDKHNLSFISPLHLHAIPSHRIVACV